MVKKTTSVKKAAQLKKSKPNQKSVNKSKFLAVKHRDFLSLLSASARNKKRRDKLIDIGNSGEISAVSECVDNILRGSVPLTKRQLIRLRRHRHALRNLALKRFSIGQKKNILKQKGGIIGAILPLALSALTSLIPSLFGGRS